MAQLEPTTIDFPLVKTFRARREKCNQANPLKIVCRAPTDLDLDGALYLRAEIHSARAPMGREPLAAQTLPLPAGPEAVIEFDSAQMNQDLGRLERRDLVLLVRAAFPGNRMETFDLVTLEMHAHPASDTAPPPPELETYPPRELVETAVLNAASAAEAAAAAEEAKETANTAAAAAAEMAETVAEFSPRIEAAESAALSAAEQADSVASVANFGLASLSYGPTLSGSPFRTTGAISSGSNVLTAASSATFAAGQGIYIAGAGAGGAPLIATITTIEANTITIDQPASTTVSGALVQHDDTDALNELLADLFATGGNFARIKSGHYRCSKWSGDDYNAILKLPREKAYTLLPRRIKIRGEMRGYMAANMMEPEPGGVVFDFRSAPTPSGGELPAAFAASPYVAAPKFSNITEEWNNVHVQLDDILFLLPPNPQFAGVNLWNATGADIGDGVTIVAAAASAGSSLLVPGFAEPTNPKAKGLIMPSYLNNIYINVGACIIMGFYDGLIPTEHCVMRRPSISWCKNGMRFPAAAHLIEGGACVENCNRAIVTGEFGTGGGSASNIDIAVQYEINATGGKWYSPNSTGALIYDPSNRLRGRMAISGYDMSNGGSGALTGRVTGAAWLHVHNIRDLHSLFIMRRFAKANAAQIVYQTSTTSLWEISLRPNEDDLVFYNYNGWSTLGGMRPMTISPDGAVTINHFKGRINRASSTDWGQLIWQTNSVSKHEISMRGDGTEDLVHYNYTTAQWDWRWKDSEIQSRLPILFSTADAVVRTRNSLGINVVDGAWVPVVGSLADKTYTVFKNTQSSGPMAGKVFLVARHGEQLYGVEMPPFPPES